MRVPNWSKDADMSNERMTNPAVPITITTSQRLRQPQQRLLLHSSASSFGFKWGNVDNDRCSCFIGNEQHYSMSKVELEELP
uniref:Uncharacterized protein n=1 Tax=Globodera pallida TaxID=36090 RepID=A0A183BWM6_GLOPA